MKKNIILGIAAVAIAATAIAVACKKGQKFEPQAANAGPSAPQHCSACLQPNGQYLDTIILPTVISSSMVLDCHNLYRLDGKTYVSGTNTVLSIPSGTRIEGIKKSTPDSASALIVTRGNRITASGSVTCPVVFTSAEANPAPGDWGGIVLLGRAPLNRADTTIEGIGEPSLPVGVDINYGGGGACQGNVNDNSGILNFVRIEYAGAVIQEGNELNGLTLGGVGAGTSLQNIQVAYGADDGFEFFGGTVNARRLISYGNNDDDLDFDFGYNGKIQFVVASKVPDLSTGYSPNPNGIESDNTPSGSCGTCKVTADSTSGAIITNVTIIGSDDANCTNPKNLLNGALFRNGSQSHLKNSIIIDYPIALNITSSCSPIQASCNLLSGWNFSGAPAGTIATNITLKNDTLTGCLSGLGNSYAKMVAPYAATPDYTLQAGSPALSGACFQGINFPGVIQVVTYRGAFAQTGGTADWTNGWARWNF